MSYLILNVGNQLRNEIKIPSQRILGWEFWQGQMGVPNAGAKHLHWVRSGEDDLKNREAFPEFPSKYPIVLSAFIEYTCISP